MAIDPATADRLTEDLARLLGSVPAETGRLVLHRSGSGHAFNQVVGDPIACVRFGLKTALCGLEAAATRSDKVVPTVSAPEVLKRMDAEHISVLAVFDWDEFEKRNRKLQHTPGGRWFLGVLTAAVLVVLGLAAIGLLSCIGWLMSRMQ
ncbi:MAG: hypothetical protein KDA22_08545 [Phycisphaerales bacterium]|nr:hypothetical protein [Phycisphaerales bacterium]